jgi:hypothetical protein
LIYADGGDSGISTEYISTKSKEIVLKSKKKPVKIEVDPNQWLLAKIEITSGN